MIFSNLVWILTVYQAIYQQLHHQPLTANKVITGTVQLVVKVGIVEMMYYANGCIESVLIYSTGQFFVVSFQQMTNTTKIWF